MNVVVSDTTALIIFAKSDTLFLLDNLFTNIYITKGVYDELSFKDDVVQYRIDNFKKILRKKITNQEILSKITNLNIDKGEIESISLALELKLGLIIDEKQGRKVAIQEGLNIVGVLGLILENFNQSFITYDESIYLYKKVKINGLRISFKLEELFYEKLKETDGKSKRK